MKNSILTLFIIPIFFLGPFQINAQKAPVVLELFTSQGCSSCPPADKLLNDVKADNVIALSYHVDYWNYIGWKDPFSSDKFTAKQRQYGLKFNNSTIYSPQMVVNGEEHFVGSDEFKLTQKIRSYSKKDAKAKIRLSDVRQNEDLVTFSYNAEGDYLGNYIRVILVIDKRVTEVKRGENRNKTLVNSNIVVSEQEFKLDKGVGKGRIAIPDIVNDNDSLSLVVLIETKTLDILAGDTSSL
ncbi:DUF1223 domain-containing protein [Winogradskyella sp. A3E31]|uniref:DUF1223 domain-containing protein n=1 Tax=Winogradskyella sp. A3E31 TaxID=3349637 RepID=UPI00398AF0A9